MNPWKPKGKPRYCDVCGQVLRPIPEWARQPELWDEGHRRWDFDLGKWIRCPGSPAPLKNPIKINFEEEE